LNYGQADPPGWKPRLYVSQNGRRYRFRTGSRRQIHPRAKKHHAPKCPLRGRVTSPRSLNQLRGFLVFNAHVENQP
jgi:hypothetical protein